MENHVALTKCFFCGNNKDILLSTRYRKNAKGETVSAVDVAKHHGKVVDYEPCPDCAKQMETHIFIFETDGEFKTGRAIFIERQAFAKCFKNVDDVIKCGWGAMTKETFEKAFSKLL